MWATLRDIWQAPSATAARLMLLAAAVFWSLGGVFIKEIDTGAVGIVFWRCLFSAMLVAPLVAGGAIGSSGGRRFPGRTDGLISIGIFLALLTTYVASTKETTAANAIFLQYTAPLYVVALGPMLVGERLRRSDAPAMAICLIGIVILFAGNQGSGDEAGLWLGVAAGFFWGLFFLWLRRIRYADPVAITFLNCAGVALLLAVVPSVWDVDAEAIAMLFVMAAVQFALPYLLFTRGIQSVPGAEASLIALAEPVLNPVWVALIFGEQPSAATVIGGVVIVGGLALRYTVFRDRPNGAAGI